jgi:hypothetical protein
MEGGPCVGVGILLALLLLFVLLFEPNRVGPPLKKLCLLLRLLQLALLASRRVRFELV